MKINRVILLCVAALLMLVVATVWAGPPTIPSSFYGTAKIDDQNVPMGTEVSARINGSRYAHVTVTLLYLGDTIYSLNIPGDDVSTPGVIEGGQEGDTIVFYLGSLLAHPTGVWHVGNTQLNLTSTLASVPTTVFVQVNPDTLMANSGATALITATVVDGIGLPMVGVTLTGNTEPSALGSVSLPGATNAAGQAYGTWTAGSAAGVGLLSVGNGSITDTVPITLNNPLPAITSLSPTTVTVGSSAFTLTITGTGFVDDSRVYWNGAGRSTTAVNSARLEAAIPAGDIAITGTAQITVANPTPGGGVSNVATLTVAPGKHKVYLPLVSNGYPPALDLALGAVGKDQLFTADAQGAPGFSRNFSVVAASLR